MDGAASPIIVAHGRASWYEISDIGMRMLQPRELFRAQGFDDTYQIETGADGKPLTADDNASFVASPSSRSPIPLKTRGLNICAMGSPTA